MLKKKSAVKTNRRFPKRLSKNLYAYVTPANKTRAQVFGKRVFGSSSNYMDWLISLDARVDLTKKYKTDAQTAIKVRDQAVHASNPKRATRTKGDMATKSSTKKKSISTKKKIVKMTARKYTTKVVDLGTSLPRSSNTTAQAAA